MRFRQICLPSILSASKEDDRWGSVLVGEKAIAYYKDVGERYGHGTVQV